MKNNFFAQEICQWVEKIAHIDALFTKLMSKG